MRTLFLALLCLGASLVGTSPAEAWASAIPDLTAAEKKQNFEGVKGLTHFRTRAYGLWVNGLEYYYYQGDTDDFQEFLHRLSTVERSSGRELRLVPGRGEVARLNRKGPKTKFDWALSLSYRFEKGPREKQQEAKAPRGPILRVTLHHAGQVDFRQIQVPEGIQVVDQNKDA